MLLRPGDRKVAEVVSLSDWVETNATSVQIRPSLNLSTAESERQKVTSSQTIMNMDGPSCQRYWLLSSLSKNLHAVAGMLHPIELQPGACTLTDTGHCMRVCCGSSLGQTRCPAPARVCVVGWDIRGNKPQRVLSLCRSLQGPPNRRAVLSSALFKGSCNGGPLR